jgi:hypothetical protein
LPTPDLQKQIDKILKGVDPNNIPDKVKKEIQKLLPPGVTLPQLPQAPQAPQLPQLPQLPQGVGLNASTSPGASQDLLNFLLGQ